MNNLSNSNDVSEHVSGVAPVVLELYWLRKGVKIWLASTTWSRIWTYRDRDSLLREKGIGWALSHAIPKYMAASLTPFTKFDVNHRTYHARCSVNKRHCELCAANF